MSEYDLKKSEKGIGQLYPILEAKDGEVIDGFHRKKADKGWKRVRLDHIDTEEKKLIARLVANFHRRQITREEKIEWINGLARIYKKQGLKVCVGVERRNAISEKIQQVTGLSKRTVVNFLHTEFKQDALKPIEEAKRPKIPASERIEHELGSEVVERLRAEVLAEEKLKIEQELRTKLAKEPTFQREVLKEISKPRILKPTEACPSGVCELPSEIESGEPIDVKAEALQQFWINNPQCKCKTCPHYGKCGVIR